MKLSRSVTAHGTWAIPLSEVRSLVEFSRNAPLDSMVTVTAHEPHPVDSTNAQLHVEWEEEWEADG